MTAIATLTTARRGLGDDVIAAMAVITAITAITAIKGLGGRRRRPLLLDSVVVSVALRLGAGGGGFGGGSGGHRLGTD